MTTSPTLVSPPPLEISRGPFSDITLVTPSGTRTHVHKIVLTKGSGYFNEILPDARRSNDIPDVFTITNPIEDAVLETVLDFLYHEPTEAKKRCKRIAEAEADDYWKLLRAANHFKMPKMTAMLVTEIIKVLAGPWKEFQHATFIDLLIPCDKAPLQARADELIPVLRLHLANLMRLEIFRKFYGKHEWIAVKLFTKVWDEKIECTRLLDT